MLRGEGGYPVVPGNGMGEAKLAIRIREQAGGASELGRALVSNGDGGKGKRRASDLIRDGAVDYLTAGNEIDAGPQRASGESKAFVHREEALVVASLNRVCAIRHEDERIVSSRCRAGADDRIASGVERNAGVFQWRNAVRIKHR